MKFKPIRKLNVALDLEGNQLKIGTLAWSTEERRAYFQYSAEFVSTPLQISPFHLYVGSGLIEAHHTPFGGIHGVFNDSLPDGWGRLLLDRRLEKHGIDKHMLTPLDRLSAVGTTGMGALTYVPEFDDEKPTGGDLDWFVEQVDLVQKEMDTADIDALQGAQGGSAGARPKIMIGFNEDQNTFVVDYGHDLEPGFDRWIVKSRSPDDPAEIGVEEQAYALMARAAGIEMAETRVIQTRQGHRLFATRRFDRTPRGRLHMHTASGLLYADHRLPSLDYAALHALTRKMTRNEAEVVQMFRRMAFNVFSKNRDDHSKNHAFLMDPNGQWHLSPAYDLTYSSGPGGQHAAAVAGEGSQPGKSDLLKVAKHASIPEKTAINIIDDVRAITDQWPLFADEAGLSQARTQYLDKHLNGTRAVQTRSSRETRKSSSSSSAQPDRKLTHESSDEELDSDGSSFSPK